MPHSTNIVAICVATYMRPLLLKNCLYSLTKIIVPKKYTPIIIVVDNDILRSGESEFNTIKKHFCSCWIRLIKKPINKNYSHNLVTK